LIFHGKIPSMMASGAREEKKHGIGGPEEASEPASVKTAAPSERDLWICGRKS
jgi:hypothetical protein